LYDLVVALPRRRRMKEKQDNNPDDLDLDLPSIDDIINSRS
jgi:hypothetical protein